MAFHFCSTSLFRSHLGQSGICEKLWENPDPSQTQKRGIVEGLLNGLPVAPMMVQVYEEKGPERTGKKNRQKSHHAGLIGSVDFISSLCVLVPRSYPTLRLHGL